MLVIIRLNIEQLWFNSLHNYKIDKHGSAFVVQIDLNQIKMWPLLRKFQQADSRR